MPNHVFENYLLYTNLHRAIKFVFWPTFWFISYIEEKFSYIEEHISTWKKSFHANFFFIFAFNQLQIILLAPPWCKDSKNVIRFKIGPREEGEKIGQTNKQTDGFSWISKISKNFKNFKKFQKISKISKIFKISKIS